MARRLGIGRLHPPLARDFAVYLEVSPSREKRGRCGAETAICAEPAPSESGVGLLLFANEPGLGRTFKEDARLQSQKAKPVAVKSGSKDQMARLQALNRLEQVQED